MHNACRGRQRERRRGAQTIRTAVLPLTHLFSVYPPLSPPPTPTAPPSPEFTLNLDEDEEYEGEEGDYDEVSGVKHFDYLPH